MELRLSSAAQRDLSDLIAWYERQQIGLGSEFLRCFDAALAEVEQFPSIGTQVDTDYRRCLTKRFPVSIYYKEKTDYCLVMAVLHQRLDLSANQKP